MIEDENYDPNDPVLIESLTKKFGSTKAVDNITFSIKQGEIFTILGHNGAGKTTAIYMLTGVLKATAGEAKVYGYKISNNIDMV
jgi:ABC-type multidrug transport system ATPase subunit